MTYFDATLEAPPITEQATDPILPEERHVFELIGFERSQPDRFRKEGGIKWTWRVFEADGRTPFIFQDEQYQFFRTTGIDKDGRPVFSVGTYANDWASAMLGRPLGVDADFKVSELRGKRMSAMVVWKPQREDPKKKSIQLASLRHVPTGTQTAAAPPRETVIANGQIPADANLDDVDRALTISSLHKSVSALKTLDATAAKAAEEAVSKSDLETAPLEDIQSLLASIKRAVAAAMDA